MIRILKEPKHTTRMKFSCLCGCVFTSDLYEYEISRDFFDREIYTITCPHCHIKRDYTSKNAELINIAEEERILNEKDI